MIGRFLSPDPVVSEPSPSQAWKLHSYVGNSPTNYVDLTGMFRAGAGGDTVYLCQNGGGGFTDETLTRTIGKGGGRHVNAFDTNGYAALRTALHLADSACKRRRGTGVGGWLLPGGRLPEVRARDGIRELAAQ